MRFVEHLFVRLTNTVYPEDVQDTLWRACAHRVDDLGTPLYVQHALG